MLIAYRAPPDFTNRHGTVQGGFLAAMLDSAAALTLFAELSSGQTAVTTRLEVDFLKQAAPGELIASATLAMRDGFWPVYLGSVVGEVAAIGLAIVIGAVAGKHLPEKLIMYGAAALFAVFGVVMIVQGLSG